MTHSTANIIATGRNLYEVGKDGIAVRTADFAGTIALSVEGADVKVFERRYDDATGDHRDNPTGISLSDVIRFTSGDPEVVLSEDEILLMTQAVVLADKERLVSLYENEVQRHSDALESVRSARDEVLRSIFYRAPATSTGDIR